MINHYLSRAATSLCAFACCGAAFALAPGDEFSVENVKYQVVMASQVDAVGYVDTPAGELVIPESVTYDGVEYQVRMVGQQAFVDCDQITSAVIGATEIDDGAFMRCSSLECIELNMDMTRIGASAFEACSSLTDFTYPGCLEEIGENAFTQCMSLTTAYIPSSVEAMGVGAYSFCMSLEEVALNHGVKAIPEEAFCGCPMLTTVDFGEVESIGMRAFAECESLSAVVLGESVTTIGDEAFNDCGGITSLVLGENVESIGDEAFSQSRSLYTIESRNTTPPEVGWRAFRRVDKESCKVYVPADALEAYQGWGDFENIAAIGGAAGLEVDDAFVVGNYRYRVLEVDTSVVLAGLVDEDDEPQGVLNIPAQVTYNDVAFNVATIGYGAFYYMPGVTEIIVPETVTTIEAYAFAYNRNAAKISLPEGLEQIGGSAFEGCEALSEITIPSTVTTIYDGAFMLCEGLREVVVPDGVTEMGSMVFEFCYGLQSITFGSGLETIPVETCSKCSNLSTINFSEFNLAIDHDAFDNCAALVNLVLPEGMESIGEWAFAECENLETIDFPTTLSNIDDAAFLYCAALEKVICRGDVPADVHEDAFLEANKDAVVYVPEDALDDYKAISWGGFTDFRSLDSDGIASAMLDDSQPSLVGCVLTLGHSGAPVVVSDALGRILYRGVANGNAIRLTPGSVVIVRQGTNVSKFAVK